MLQCVHLLFKNHIYVIHTYIHTLYIQHDHHNAIDLAKEEGHVDIVSDIEKAIAWRRVKNFVLFLHTGPTYI